MKKLINFPHLLGQRKVGVNKTCKYLKKIFANDFVDVKCNNSTKHKYNNMVNNLWNLYRTNILYENKINIGGDHSMSLATVADSLNRTKENELKVIWFDAHPDINTYKSSPSKNFHGMPLSYLTGLDINRDFSFITNRLSLDNILYVGIRDINRYEKKVIKYFDMSYISSKEFNSNPLDSYKYIKSFIGDDPVHLSFDVDCLDPSIIPCTGTAVKDGLLLEETKFIIDELSENKNIINMDITELNLELGDKEDKVKSLNNYVYLFDKYLKKIN